MPITLRELTTETDWQTAYPLLRQQNKSLTEEEYRQLLEKMLPAGYRCLGAFSGAALVGVMGFWVGHRFWCKKYMDLDNVVVDEAARSQRIGQKMLAWAQDEAKALGCHIMGLDSYTTAHRAHRFYFREGYVILGYHFTKHLGEEP